MVKTALIAVVGSLLLSGCGRQSSPSEPTSVAGNLTLEVRVTAAGGAVASIEVALLRSPSREAVASKTTDSAGRAAFSDISAGSYIVSVGYTYGFFAPEKTVSMTSSSVVDFPLSPTDDLVIDCIQADAGPCIPPGGTAQYPSQLTISGRWSLVTIPLTGALVPHSVVSLVRGPATSTMDGNLIRPGGNFQLTRSQATWSVRFLNYSPCLCDPREGIACLSSTTPFVYPLICSATTTGLNTALWQCPPNSGTCNVISGQRTRDFLVNWTRK